MSQITVFVYWQAIILLTDNTSISSLTWWRFHQAGKLSPYSPLAKRRGLLPTRCSSHCSVLRFMVHIHHPFLIPKSTPNSFEHLRIFLFSVCNSDLFGQSVPSRNALNPPGCLEHGQQNKTCAIKCKDVCEIVSFSNKYKFVLSLTSSVGINLWCKSAAAAEAWAECPRRGHGSVNNWSGGRLPGELKTQQTDISFQNGHEAWE